MNRFYQICFGFMLISNIVFSQYKLDIEIIEIRNNIGKIMLQLFDEDKKIVTQDMSEIKENRCIFSISNLKAARYAVRFYHDENLNGRMDSNIFDKPTEGYGFSNNVIEKFGPPPFEKWLFELNSDKKLVLISNY